MSAPVGGERSRRGRLGANLAATFAVLRRSPSHEADSALGASTNWLLWVAVATAVVVATAVLLDAAAANWSATAPDGVVGFFQAITVAGKSNWYLIPTGAALVLLAVGDWGTVDQRLRAAWCEIASLVVYAFASFAAAAIAVNLVKQVIGRARPVLFERDGWLAFDPFNFDYANASFPSGHATTAGAVTMVGMLVFPRLRWPILAAGVLIAISRVVVGAHYPSDAVAGFALGAGIAYALARFAMRRRAAFGVDDDGRIRPRTARAGAAFREAPAAMIVAPLRAIVARAR